MELSMRLLPHNTIEKTMHFNGWIFQRFKKVKSWEIDLPFGELRVFHHLTIESSFDLFLPTVHGSVFDSPSAQIRKKISGKKKKKRTTPRIKLEWLELYVEYLVARRNVDLMVVDMRRDGNLYAGRGGKIPMFSEEKGVLEVKQGVEGDALTSAVGIRADPWEAGEQESRLYCLTPSRILQDLAGLCTTWAEQCRNLLHNHEGL